MIMRRGGKRDAAAGGDAATPRPMAYDVLLSPEGSVQESDKKEPRMTKEARYGTPDELKALINRAHELGLSVLLDIVHSHAVKNTAEGIAGFDGTDGQFFKEGPAGFHPAWDSASLITGKPA